MTNDAQIAQQLKQRLVDGVNAWKPDAEGRIDLPLIYHHWRGRLKPGTDAPCISMVEYARWAFQPSQAEDNECLEVLEDQTKALLQLNPFGQESVPLHCVGVARGLGIAKAIAHVVKAIICKRDRDIDRQIDIDGVREHINIAAALYGRLWPICKVPLAHSNSLILPSESSSNHFDPKQDALFILSQLDRSKTTATTWLILYELLLRMLGGKQTAQHQNRMKLLVIGRDQKDSELEKGRVLNASIKRLDTPYYGFYPDPLSFGITHIDKSTRDSMRLAWRCCGSNWNAVEAPFSHRIEVDFNSMAVQTLTGNSAGGLLAATMYATVMQRKLSEGVSATCSLRTTKSQREADETEPLERHEVVIGKINGVVAKAREAWLNHDIERMFVNGEDRKVWYQAGQPGPMVTAVTCLADLIDKLDRDRPCIDKLEQIAIAQHGRWDRIIQAQLMPRQDRDHRHRLDLYVEPSFKIEGPLELETATGLSGETDEVDSDEMGSESRQDPIYQRTYCLELTVPGKALTDEPMENLRTLAFGSFENPNDLSDTIWAEANDWLSAGKDILLYDRAGAGKSVCTLRMVHLLTDSEKWRTMFGHDCPPLVIRIEGESNGKDLPSIRELVKKAIAANSDDFEDMENDLLKRTVEFVFRTKRAVVIVDGFDQFRTPQREQMIRERKSEDGRNCRWIIASRQHTIDMLFDSKQDVEDWMRVRIEPFSKEHQDKFFENAKLGDIWERSIDRESMGDLLESPVVLDQLREFIESNKESEIPVIIESRSQLALVTALQSLDRALSDEKLGDALPRTQLKRHQQLEYVEHVLALMAFECMLQGNYEGRVIGSKAKSDFLEACEGRFQREFDLAILQIQTSPPFLGSDRKLNKLRDDRELLSVDWKWAVEASIAIETYHRPFVDQNDADVLSYRNRKSVEYYAARYLTKYATEWDIYANDLSDEATPCAWNHIADPQWSEVWMLAIQMPQEPLPLKQENCITNAVLDPLVTCRSLSALFRLPKSHNGKKERRPTRLMYECWHLFEYAETRSLDLRFRVDGKLISGSELVEQDRKDLFERLSRRMLLGERPIQKGICVEEDPILMRHETLRRFRQTSRELVKEFEIRFDTVLINDGTRVPIPVDKPEKTEILSKWRNQTTLEKSLTLLQCPPKSWIDAYEQNKSGRTDPRVNSAIEGHEKEAISQFRIGATTVSHRLFRIFDAHLPDHRRIAPKQSHIDQGDFPAINVTWYDAFIFCKWLGNEYRLPDDWEWEHACRAGTTTHYNCYAEHLAQNANFAPERGCTVIGSYPSNAYGLFDTHGNVWEWCQNWCSDRESQRSLRGGSWFYDDDYCHSSRREGLGPGNLLDSVGFRLCRE